MDEDARTETPLLAAPPEPEESLHRLVGAARSHLQWLSDQGVAWVPGGPSPRKGVEVSKSPAGDPSPEDLSYAGAEGALHAATDPSSAMEPSRVATTSPRPVAASGATPHVAPSVPGSGTSAGVGAPWQGLSTGAAGLLRVREELGDCRRCGLSRERIQLVFGQGNPEAFLMFIGEAPGRDEDLAGEPFVGPAGALLTKMIAAMGLGREEVFIANVIKCRPSRNRDPQPEEIAACLPFLLGQIQAVGPQVIVTLGRYAAQTLLQTEAPVGRLRGTFQALALGGRNIPLMPTYHPAYLLRNAEAKRPVWEDLKQVIALLRSRGLLGAG